METNSRKLLRKLRDDGWEVARIRGDHHTLKHTDHVGLITLPHPKKDLPTGLVRRIYGIAGRDPKSK
ncbi:MAG: type II toxin-antitoxin system HicA family toxin [Alphaproteobacteria bacterium]|nr:type II toxin-antitoxin system HicA family toxin [Alphaproteobacteria bacterium]